MITKEKKKKIFKEYGGSEKNSGVTEAQVALMTERIKDISDHLADHKKDHDALRTLRILVQKRRKLMNYLRGKDIKKYRALKKELKIRN